MHFFKFYLTFLFDSCIQYFFLFFLQQRYKKVLKETGKPTFLMVQFIASVDLSIHACFLLGQISNCQSTLQCLHITQSTFISLLQKEMKKNILCIFRFILIILKLDKFIYDKFFFSVFNCFIYGL